jgi:hypothetical protein
MDDIRPCTESIVYSVRKRNRFEHACLIVDNRHIDASTARCDAFHDGARLPHQKTCYVRCMFDSFGNYLLAICPVATEPLEISAFKTRMCEIHRTVENRDADSRISQRSLPKSFDSRDGAQARHSVIYNRRISRLIFKRSSDLALKTEAVCGTPSGRCWYDLASAA